MMKRTDQYNNCGKASWGKAAVVWDFAPPDSETCVDERELEIVRTTRGTSSATARPAGIPTG
jgi:hypothetical protein